MIWAWRLRRSDLTGVKVELTSVTMAGHAAGPCVHALRSAASPPQD
jgi:hypothetical protein